MNQTVVFSSLVRFFASAVKNTTIALARAPKQPVRKENEPRGHHHPDGLWHNPTAVSESAWMLNVNPICCVIWVVGEARCIKCSG